MIHNIIFFTNIVIYRIPLHDHSLSQPQKNSGYYRVIIPNVSPIPSKKVKN